MTTRTSFSGRVAVVTGAGSGIGRALVRRLAAAGAEVAASDVSGAAARSTADSCGDLAGRVRGYELDVADREAIYKHADQVRDDFGRVDLVVNNAGVALRSAVRDMTDEDLNWIMDINFWGVVHGSRAFLPHLEESGGHLVNVSSVFGFVGVPTQSAYNASKFAVRGFTEALRQEVLAEGSKMRVSVVHPGGVRTNIARSARGIGSGERDRLAGVFERIARTTPEGAARTIVNGIERDRPRILIGPDAYFFDALPRVLGPAYQQLIARVAGRLVQ